MFYRIEYFAFYGEWVGCSIFCDGRLRAPKTNQVSVKDRFYFTQKGFDYFGRNIVSRIASIGLKYRIIKVKENHVDVKYRDKHQVAGKIKRGKNPLFCF